MEGVHVFHFKLATTEDSGFSPKLVAEFELDLIEGEREIFVRFDDFFGQGSNDLFVRLTESIFTTSARFEFEKNVDIVPGAGSFPIGRRVESGHEDFDSTNGIHFLTNDGANVVENSESKRKIVINAGHELANETSLDKKLMINGISILGRIFLGTEGKMRHFHIAYCIRTKRALTSYSNLISLCCMAEKTNNNQLFLSVLVVLVAGGGFLLGNLWTRVQQLENGTASQVVAKAADNNNVAGAEDAANNTGIRDLTDADKANWAKIMDSDHIRGNKDAKVALIEYSDLECPFCKKFHQTAQALIDQYDGQVMWIYRHFPLDQLHPKARQEAAAVECALKLNGADGFWKLTDKIYEVTPSNNGLDLATLPDLAASVGVDKAAFSDCLANDKEVSQIVEDEYQTGVKAGVSGTPGNILVNFETGKMQLIPGAVPIEQITPVVDQLLSSK